MGTRAPKIDAAKASKRVLVLEGDRLSPMGLSDRLGKMGFTVLPACEALDAHRLAHVAELDGAVIDGSSNSRIVGDVTTILTERKVPFLVVRDVPPTAMECGRCGFLAEETPEHELRTAIGCIMLPQRYARARLVFGNAPLH